ncbi:hypothetical protein [Paenibacillus sp. P46E]|uniref:hypothetical protein n=1 Tax=Paenibacillus sp. P46E TaxID=1349436 RepID=UPI000939355B|nr:hypothetical protein [Paenibacillus sp. P46E]OKP95381.1 hypothetical protein A3849_26210 [Paenibacillus sp. P46E]
MAFARRIISKFLDPDNLKRHNDNFADIESDLTNHRNRLGTIETEQVNQGNRISTIIAHNGDGTKDTELIDARGGQPLLSDRLDATDAQLADTADFLRSDRNAELPLPIPTYDGSGQSTHPSVIHVPGRWAGFEYWMAHTPYPDTNDDYENPSVVCSQDGVEWLEPAQNPIDKPTADETARGAYMSDNEIILVNGVLECWYRFTDPDNNIERLYRKKSSDGLTWTAREVVYDLSGTDRAVLSPALIHENGIYRMWYVQPNGDIFLAESETGASDSWGEPVPVPLSYRSDTYRPWHISVFKDGPELYYLILNAFEPDSDVYRHVLIGHSKDGTSFGDIFLLLSPNTRETKRFDSFYLYRASLVRAGSVYRLYYSAYSTAGKWRIGMIQGDKIETLKKSDYVTLASEHLYPPVLTTSVSLTGGAYFNREEVYLQTPGLKSVKFKNIAAGVAAVLTQAGALANLQLLKLLFKDSAYANNEEVLFRTDGVKAAKLKNTGPNKITVQKENGDAAELEAETLSMGEGAYVNKEEVYLQTSGVKSVKIKNTGVETAAILSEANLPAILEVKAVVCKGDGPAIEGAIRYNTSTKKHEGYNGTTWNALY